MDPDETLSPGGGPPPDPGQDPPGNDGLGVESRRGRRPIQEEVEAYLAKNGLVTSPADAGAAPGVAEVAGTGAFDEVAARSGLEILVEGASGIAVSVFEGKAGEILEDRDKAHELAQTAAIHPEAKKVIVTSGVAICRKHGVTIGPELTLTMALGQVGYQWRALYNDLKRLAEAKSPVAKEGA